MKNLSCVLVSSPLFWWFNLRVTPLPIPNREVKPYCSDDTDIVGKVACRQNKGLERAILFNLIQSKNHRKVVFAFPNFLNSYQLLAAFVILSP
jgi:hypothetical protein